MQAQFQYHADGNLKFANDQVNNFFDRSFAYDQVNRLQASYSGAEARVYNGQPSTGLSGPYWQNWQYDSWDNMTQRNNRYWSSQATLTAGYASDRNQNPAWTYDTAGHVTKDDESSYDFDATGQNIKVWNPAHTALIISQNYDGEGQAIKRTYSGLATWYVRSSVLGGTIIIDLNSQGQMAHSNVFLRGALLAHQNRFSNGDQVRWQHENPLTGSMGESDSSTNYAHTGEMDAGGVDFGIQDLVLGNPDLPEPVVTRSSSDILTCYVDGISQLDCGWTLRLLEAGSAKIDPDHYSDPSALLRLGIVGHWNDTEGKTKTIPNPDYYPGAVDNEGFEVSPISFSRSIGTTFVVDFVSAVSGEAIFGGTVPQKKRKKVTSPVKKSSPWDFDPEVTDSAGRKCKSSERKPLLLKNRNTTAISHTWFELPKTSHNAGNWGYGPAVVALKGTGILENNSDPKIYISDFTIRYTVCPETLMLLDRSIDNNAKGIYIWNNDPAHGGYNCTGWACGRLEDAGIKPPESSKALFKNKLSVFIKPRHRGLMV